MSILAQLLFNWIFAALSAGTPPAQFDANGNYMGGAAHTRTVATMNTRGK
jgi:hypothetical protein